MGDMELTHDEHKCINQAGYKCKKVEAGYDFYVFTGVFINEICKGYNHKNVCAELVNRSLLIRGKDQHKYVKNQRLPIGIKKIYHLSSTILSDGNREEDV
jgi:hypothetical protein